MSEAIKRLRIAAGKARSEVAADLDISERHLQRLESGDSPITRRWILVFASYYGVAPEAIEDGDGVAA